ncbi:hemK methyltransferase family member 1, partial [Asbolus verrucosus]
LCSTDAGDFGDNKLVTNCVGNNGANYKCTVGDLLNQWTQKFEENSISEPKESVEHILAHCLGTRRLSVRLPVQYIIGEWSFRSLNLKMSPPVFIPRPETEELVDIVSAEIARDNVAHVLDLCCGSGAISLSLLQERPIVKVTAVDQSKEACGLTKENAQKNDVNSRIRIIQSELGNLEFHEKFDLIVSNPPYDLRALNGGKDGLDVIKIILKLSSEYLNENGKLFLEVEPRHPKLLRNYLLANSALRLAYAETYKDFSV